HHDDGRRGGRSLQAQTDGTLGAPALGLLDRWPGARRDQHEDGEQGDREHLESLWQLDPAAVVLRDGSASIERSVSYRPNLSAVKIRTTCARNCYRWMTDSPRVGLRKTGKPPPTWGGFLHSGDTNAELEGRVCTPAIHPAQAGGTGR